MKKLLLILCGFAFFITCLPMLVAADMMVPESLALPGYTNPQQLANSGNETEEAWLEGLLGLTYDDPSVELVWKDDNGANGWQTPDDWIYAVLKYGSPQAPDPGLDHYAIYNDDGGSGIDIEGVGLSYNALSHINFSRGTSVPEPAGMFLLGTGLIGLAALGRRKFRK